VSIRIRPLVLYLFVGCIAALAQGLPKLIVPGDSLEGTLAPGQSQTYSLTLRRGETALVIVRQDGVDVVVDVDDPAGKRVDSVDSPTGRSGDEVVRFTASDPGAYAVKVRPFDEKEPVGRYTLKFVSVKDEAQSARELEEAERWMAQRSATISGSARGSFLFQKRIMSALQGARVVGLGEATHGSREFNDVRVALTQQLIERSGFRIVAIEGSAVRLRALEPYINGDSGPGPDVTKRIASGWIGRRALRQMIEWARAWNLRHPRDRVRLIGLDGQENQDARRELGPFLAKTYGERVGRRWQEAELELSAADEQTAVFGDSGVNGATKQFLLEVNAMLDLDAAILRQRYPGESDAAREAARALLEFADFNSSGEGGVISHSRDHYMAARILRSLEERGAGAKAVYWAHNAHVVHPKSSLRTTGGVLRDVMGCGYRAIALTFREGAFVAQVPNDKEDRLAVSTVPAAPTGTVESLLARAGNAPALALWDCEPKHAPEWFALPRKMHWVGALYKPGTDPAEAFRPFTLLEDFDGVVYLPSVAAEDVPTDRPLIPARKR